MRKLIYLLLLAAACSLVFNSCNRDDKDHSEDDIDSLTLLAPSASVA